MDQFSRTELVLGAAAVAHLKTCRVAIFGVGGVGGYAAEALGAQRRRRNRPLRR